jgi:hypothetical protein
LPGRLVAEFGELRDFPSRPDLFRGCLLLFWRSLGYTHGTGEVRKSCSLPLVIVKDIVSEPPKVLAIHTIDMLPFIEVGDGEPVPKVNGLPVIRGNVSNRLSFVVVKDLFHRDCTFREKCLSGQTATRKDLNSYQFIRNDPVRQPQSRHNGLRGSKKMFMTAHFAPWVYRANSTALVSRMTVTLICPG